MYITTISTPVCNRIIVFGHQSNKAAQCRLTLKARTTYPTIGVSTADVSAILLNGWYRGSRAMRNVRNPAKTKASATSPRRGPLPPEKCIFVKEPPEWQVASCFERKGVQFSFHIPLTWKTAKCRRFTTVFLQIYFDSSLGSPNFREVLSTSMVHDQVCDELWAWVTKCTSRWLWPDLLIRHHCANWRRGRAGESGESDRAADLVAIFSGYPCMHDHAVAVDDCCTILAASAELLIIKETWLVQLHHQLGPTCLLLSLFFPFHILVRLPRRISARLGVDITLSPFSLPPALVARFLGWGFELFYIVSRFAAFTTSALPICLGQLPWNESRKICWNFGRRSCPGNESIVCWT